MASIYLIEFPLHNKFYVGKTKRIPVSKRINEHHHSTKNKTQTDKLARWYYVNGKKTINTIVEDNLSIEKMDELEVFYIRYFNYLGLELTNHHDKECKSVDWTEERKKQQRVRMENFDFTPEIKKKMSLAKKGRKIDWGYKISKGKLGKKYGKMKLIHKTNHYQSFINSRGRAVTQLDKNNKIIKEYTLISLAAESLQTQYPKKNIYTLRNGIKDCCTGKQKTSYGYIWRYKKL